MRFLKYIPPIFVIAFLVYSCKNETVTETKTVEVNTPVKEKTLNPDANYIAASFEIEGMKCAMGCAKVIEKNISKMDGVKEAKVDFETKTATVSFDEAMVDREKLMATVKNTSETYLVTSWNDVPLEIATEGIEE